MISIIVPTLNESENIPKFLKNLIKIRFKYELIFVDDNSWDNTQNIIKKIKNKRIKFILRKDKIRDLSKSVMLGIENSKYNYVCFQLKNCIPKYAFLFKFCFSHMGSLF